MRPAYRCALAVTAVLATTGLVGCGAGGEGGASSKAGGITITATDTSCEVAKQQLPAGTSTFDITNKGGKVTEVYVYAPGDRIVTERANIAPGAQTSLVVELKAGRYQIACKPGMTGRGIRQDISVSGAAVAPSDPRLDRAVADYRVYVAAQADDSLAKAREFVAAIKDGDVAKAKRLYAPSRVGWERIEPVAESFGDLDPRVDLREADLEQGQRWTGWHRLEKALWKEGSVKGTEPYCDQLIRDLEELKKRVGTVEITPTSMANGAKELLDEVATGKVTGEEEAFSHTDLWDFKANVDGANKVFTLLAPIVREKDVGLAGDLERAFGKVDRLLAKYQEGGGYVSYDGVGKAERKELSDAVNALAEPLSNLAKAVVK